MSAYTSRRFKAQHINQNIIPTDDTPQPATDFETAHKFRVALVNVLYEMPDLDAPVLVDMFNAEMARSADKAAVIKTWQGWFRQIDDAIKARDKAVAELAELDKTQAGSIGWWMAVDDVTLDRDEAQATINLLKHGPVAE